MKPVKNTMPMMPQTETERFQKALLELKELRSQLHNAADHCESAFLNSEHKKVILENTRNYVCQAVVAVVDHLGNVSSKIEKRLQDNTEIVDTEKKIECLKQRIFTCQQYSNSLELYNLQWIAKIPRHHQHYTSPMNLRTLMPIAPNGLTRNGDVNVTIEPEESNQRKDQLLLEVHPSVVNNEFSFTSSNTPTKFGLEFANAVPVLSKSLSSRSSNSTFRLKHEGVYLLGGGEKKKKSLHMNNLLPFWRANKRKPMMLR